MIPSCDQCIAHCVCGISTQREGSECVKFHTKVGTKDKLSIGDLYNAATYDIYSKQVSKGVFVAPKPKPKPKVPLTPIGSGGGDYATPNGEVFDCNGRYQYNINDDSTIRS